MNRIAFIVATILFALWFLILAFHGHLGSINLWVLPALGLTCLAGGHI